MGAYSNNSVIQTGTNGGKNVSVVSSDGRGIVSQVYQQANGAGSMNDLKLSQTGNNSYAGSQQNATNGGKNKVDWTQTGYDIVNNAGSKANILQNADGAGSMNTLTGTQNVGFAEGVSAAELTQTATAGGVNEASVDQGGEHNNLYLDQTADGAGSKNTATIIQDGVQLIADYAEIFIDQEAFTGGTNTATVTQGTDSYESYVDIEQYAETGGINEATVNQNGGDTDYDVADAEQEAYDGGKNVATFNQDMLGAGGTDNEAYTYQYAEGAGSVNTLTISQAGSDDDNVYVDQYAYDGATNTATVSQHLLTAGGLGSVNNYAETDQIADGAGSSNTATVSQEGFDNTAYVDQNAYDGATNTATVNQNTLITGQGDNYADVYQYAEDAGSSNTATVTQDGEDGSEAYVAQYAYDGASNTATINQFQDADNEYADIYQYADGAGSQNTATIEQEEDDDEAYIYQEANNGASNTALIQQNLPSKANVSSYATITQLAEGAGSKNDATVVQEGDNHYAEVLQTASTPGSENEATITQLDQNNYSYVEQVSASAESKNTATVKQGTNSSGLGNNSIIVQTAVVDGQNEATVTQDGNNTSRIDQRANSAGINKMTVTQLGEGNFAIANQIGTNNTGTQVQTGDLNYVRLEQIGDGNTANMTQTGNNNGVNLNQIGDGNIANITQTGNGNVGGVINVVGNGNNTTLIQN